MPSTCLAYMDFAATIMASIHLSIAFRARGAGSGPGPGAYFTPDERPKVIDHFDSLRPDVTFTFVDVIPGVSGPHEFHNFRTLVAEANNWLPHHLVEWEIINCETINLFFKRNEETFQLKLTTDDTFFPVKGDVEPNTMYGLGHAHYMYMSSVHGLRIWLQRRSSSSDGVPSNRRILKFVDFSPLEDAGDNDSIKKLDELLESVNKKIERGLVDPHMSDIISIQTVHFPLPFQKTTSSACNFAENNSAFDFPPSRSVAILRVFYFHSPEVRTPYPIIGVKDFIPKQVRSGGFLHMPVYESFSTLVSTASEWLSSHPENSFTNAQCLEVRVKSILGSRPKIDSKSMSPSFHRGNYVRIFRIAYTTTKWPDAKEQKSMDSDSLLPPPPPIYLSSTIFNPADGETTVLHIKKRINDWVQEQNESVHDIEITNSENNQDVTPHHYKLVMLSGETITTFCKEFNESEILNETENTFKPNRIGVMNQVIFTAFRVYFDIGYFSKRDGRQASYTMLVASHRRKTPLSQCVLV